MSGKGSKRRKEDRKKVESNWDNIQWGTVKPKPKKPKRDGSK